MPSCCYGCAGSAGGCAAPAPMMAVSRSSGTSSVGSVASSVSAASLAPAPLSHPMSSGGYDVPLALHVNTNSQPVQNEIADAYRRR
ncbi:unnamed protein product [Anisakis simplex]|uniref:Secreted protein n=1 Tax=Anisakis simplex TaxID=6269 RepID=A0A0M3K1U8_ANISI|nr:unnamed protein product [Anisakis simplex]